MKAVNKISKVLSLHISEPVKSDVRSKSQKLFSDVGLMRFNNGFGTLSPLLVRSLRKLENILRKEMEDVSALEIMLPTLTELKLFEKTGRSNLPDLFKLEINKKKYVLNPTCEEAITDLLASANMISHAHLPLRYFQISNKFRNEKRSKSGMLRAKEFIMKDLYCFDSNMESNMLSYKEITEKYHKIFKNLEVPYVMVKGLQGDIGGVYSNEYHYISNAGEDNLFMCQECGHNESFSSVEVIDQKCPKCMSKNVKSVKGIEVGHTFQLGTRFSEPLKATYINKRNEKELLYMSSYGLGLSRIIAASVEVLSTDNEIKWPLSIAPYSICIIPPKDGSKEEENAQNFMESIYQNLNKMFDGDLLIDDRTHSTIGKRFHDVKSLGFPYVIVVGKDINSNPPCVEIFDLIANSKSIVQTNDLLQFMLNMFSQKPNDYMNFKKEECIVR